MEKFILSAETIQNEIASTISARFAEKQAASGSSGSHLPVVAHTEVFLLIPDPTNKDADLVLVTPEKLSHCLDMQKKKEIFNFGALFRRYRQMTTGNIYGPPTLHQLLKELNNIVEWYQIGIHLDIPKADLEDIKRESDDVNVCRSKVLSTWFQRNHEPTWATIITALAAIGRGSLACKMALKYGVPVPTSMGAEQVPTTEKKHSPGHQKLTSRVPVPTSMKSEQVPTPEKKHGPIHQRLSRRIDELKLDIQSRDMELVVHKQTTTEARNAREIARGQVDKVGEKAVEVRAKVALLFEKSRDTQQELELKRSTQRAFQKLPEMEKEEFQGVIYHTNQEIQKLQREFDEIQAELTSEREKACSLPEQLEQATKELAEKSAKVRELEWARQELETLLEQERKSVNQLLMQASVASDLRQHRMEIKNQLDAAKKELEAKTGEIDLLKQTIANQDEEVNVLSTELRAKEGLLKMLLVQLSQATEPDNTQQLKLQGLTKEISELRDKLIKAEDAKQEAERRMMAAETESRLLQKMMTENTCRPAPAPPKPITKASTTWEYRVFTENSAEIITKLANVKLAGEIADKLKAARIFGQSIWHEATTYGPSVTPVHRIRPIIGTLNDKIQQNAQAYHQFRSILLSIGPDAETALYYMPEKDPTEPRTKRARTPSKGKAPQEDPSAKRHATEQQKMTLQWTTHRDTPQFMMRGSAVTHNKMAYFNPRRSTDVYQFDPEEEEWLRLPNCPHYNSALTVVNTQLTTVGGSHGILGDGVTNSLASLTGEGEDRKWVEQYPRMPTCRYDFAALCWGTSLIAAGGDDGGRIVSTVEVMDTESLQWTHVSPLPQPMDMASITVCDNQLYLLGGCNQNGRRTLSVFTCSMTELLQTQPLDAQAEKTANQMTAWHQAANTPLYLSTAVSIGDVLLAIGGQSAAGGETSAIVSYHVTSGTWEDIGHITKPRSAPLVAILPSNKLIVAGGFGGRTKVEIGKIVA